jgi:hypothetical protein
MASYTIQLTPSLVNLATEGSLDTAVVSGVSIQRTAYLETVASDGGRKVLELLDGEAFTDTPEDPTDYSNGAGGNWIV